MAFQINKSRIPTHTFITSSDRDIDIESTTISGAGFTPGLDSGITTKLYVDTEIQDFIDELSTPPTGIIQTDFIQFGGNVGNIEIPSVGGNADNNYFIMDSRADDGMLPVNSTSTAWPVPYDGKILKFSMSFQYKGDDSPFANPTNGTDRLILHMDRINMDGNITLPTIDITIPNSFFNNYVVDTSIVLTAGQRINIRIGTNEPGFEFNPGETTIVLVYRRDII